MSRTIKGNKGPGYEYASRRPMSWVGFGKWIKKCTNRIERQEGKRNLKNAKD